MQIPDKGPGVIKTGVNYIGAKASKYTGLAGAGKVLASNSEGVLDKVVDGLTVPVDIAGFISSIKEKINFLIGVGKTGGDTTFNQFVEGKDLFFTPTIDYLKKVGDNFELFDDGITKILSQDGELWENAVETLAALVSVGGVYIILVPFLLKLIIYKDHPDISQRVRNKITKALARKGEQVDEDDNDNQENCDEKEITRV